MKAKGDIDHCAINMKLDKDILKKNIVNKFYKVLNLET